MGQASAMRAKLESEDCRLRCSSSDGLYCEQRIRTVHPDQGKHAECSKDGADDAEEDLAVGVGGNDGSSWTMGAIRDVVGCART